MFQTIERTEAGGATGLEALEMGAARIQVIKVLNGIGDCCPLTPLIY